MFKACTYERPWKDGGKEKRFLRSLRSVEMTGWRDDKGEGLFEELEVGLGDFGDGIGQT